MRQHKYGLIVPHQIDHYWCDPHAATTVHKTSLSSTLSMFDKNDIFEIKLSRGYKSMQWAHWRIGWYQIKVFLVNNGQSKFQVKTQYDTFLLNLILCLDFIFDLVFGFHRCSIKYLGVWMVSRDGCLKVAGSHKHSTAVVLVSKRKVVWYKQPESSIWVKPK